MPHLKMPFWMWMQNPLAGSHPLAVFSYKQIIYSYKKPWQSVRIAYREAVWAALKPCCVVSWSFCTSLSCRAARLATAIAGGGMVPWARTQGATPILTAAPPYADFRALWTSMFRTQCFIFHKLYPYREKPANPPYGNIWNGATDMIHSMILWFLEFDGEKSESFGCHQVYCE